MLKKTGILILLLLLAALSLLQYPAATASAEKTEQKIYLWADGLVRKPDDPPYHSLYYRWRHFYFAVKPHHEHAIVFLGDSITDEGNWRGLFPKLSVENMGIGGDTTLGVLNRLNQVIAVKPSLIFLMIGTNDLCFNRSETDILDNYRQILDRLHAELPGTTIVIQSVLPFNDKIFPSNALRTNRNIRDLNLHLALLAREYNEPFFDLTPVFSDDSGELRSRYTRDGLHLNEAGYELWRKQLERNVIFPDH